MVSDQAFADEKLVVDENCHRAVAIVECAESVGNAAEHAVRREGIAAGDDRSEMDVGLASEQIRIRRGARSGCHDARPPC
jgi:hypothetical protein